MLKMFVEHSRRCNTEYLGASWSPKREKGHFMPFVLYFVAIITVSKLDQAAEPRLWNLSKTLNVTKEVNLTKALQFKIIMRFLITKEAVGSCIALSEQMRRYTEIVDKIFGKRVRSEKVFFDETAPIRGYVLWSIGWHTCNLVMSDRKSDQIRYFLYLVNV